MRRISLWFSAMLASQIHAMQRVSSQVSRLQYHWELFSISLGVRMYENEKVSNVDPPYLSTEARFERKVGADVNLLGTPFLPHR